MERCEPENVYHIGDIEIIIPDEMWETDIGKKAKKEATRIMISIEEHQKKRAKEAKMRILIVSNRLPITLDNNLEFKQSVGGLVSGLSAYMDFLKDFTDCLWIGWPGASVSESQENNLKIRLKEINSIPVFLSEECMENFYQGFCNKTIWPLFHYFPAYASYDKNTWKYYKEVNNIFCDSIIDIIQPGDIIWIHDYHLMLLPKLLRDRLGKKNPIGFFLHIPFPDYEMFRQLPKGWRRSILEGILGADLIGFHTEEYTQYFLDSVYKILGYSYYLGDVQLKNRVARIGAFPMGIPFEKFNKTVVEFKDIDDIKDKLSGKSILSIDRLDYTKGVVNRLLCYELFLERYKQWHRKIVFNLIVVPSRIDIEHYERNKRRIDEIVGRINGKYGDINWAPIIYQYKFISFDLLLSLYRISDIALITPLRDGMNLIAKEYVASLSNGIGMLILSETAGSAKELEESIIVNPNDREEVVRALDAALNMPVEEQIRRNRIMQNKLSKNDAIRWANDFITNLKNFKETIGNKLINFN